MQTFTRNAVIAFSLGLGLSAVSARAQSQAPSTYMHVHAPFAQTLVVKVKAAHDADLIKLGLHATPPGRNG